MVFNKLLIYSLVFLIVSWPISEVMSIRSRYKTHGDKGIWAPRNSVSGLPLPSVRGASKKLLLEGHHLSPTYYLIFTQFGQFISYDVSMGVDFAFGTSHCSTIVPLYQQDTSANSKRFKTIQPVFNTYHQFRASLILTKS